MFLIYINDIAHVSTKLFPLLFADDSNMFLPGKDPNELIRIMNDEIVYIRGAALNVVKNTHFFGDNFVSIALIHMKFQSNKLKSLFF